ncbi:MAG: hypothetical protein O9302_01500 [Cyclobacteriaceae bacterium]|jgi:hypothetical protein|nr:hypothetical protein [Flammeovirgaceae bacterium]MCZ8023064.1 hypothetical protein [Cytophagales bacterium]MCZ8326706.1 hypothetical protein [Cyclobacteriaceae bacterium]
MRILILTTCWIVSWFGAGAQVKKQFVVENTTACELVKLSLKANSSNCYIKPSQGAEVLTVFSNQSEQEFSHRLAKTVRGNQCLVNLEVEEQGDKGISQSISARMFNSSEGSVNTSNKFWKMYLSTSKPYALEMTYGIGSANIDLSGLAIKKLKINSGSADVVVNYISGVENQVEMDTFFVKVDLGSVMVKNISFAKAKVMLADVGFGNMTLDFSQKPLIGNTIKGSVGAGNLIILLPTDQTPVFVHIKDSWLCSIKMPASLKKTGENTFATANYTKGDKQAIVFDLDVSMGSILFKEGNR